MVFLDLLCLTSLNVSCVVTLSQVHPTMILARLIWLRLPYAGYIGESIKNRLVRKLKRGFKEPVCFKIFYQTKKLSSFCMDKVSNPMYLKSHVIYKLTSPACNATYIGNTDRCRRVRLDEHNSDHNSAMFQHLHSCEAFKFLFSLNNLPGCFNNKSDVANFTSHVNQTILNNAKIIAWNNNYNQLCFFGIFIN